MAPNSSADTQQKNQEVQEVKQPLTDIVAGDKHNSLRVTATKSPRKQNLGTSRKISRFQYKPTNLRDRPLFFVENLPPRTLQPTNTKTRLNSPAGTKKFPRLV